MSFASSLVALIIAVTGIRLFLSIRQIRHVQALRSEVPARFAERITPEAHARAASYTVAKARLNLVTLVLEAALALFFTVGGGLQIVSQQIDSLVDAPLLRGLLLFAGVSLIGTCAELPLALYRTFGVEARFGFNRITPTLFVQDRLRDTALAVLVGGPLIAGVLWMMGALGAMWWVWTWLAWMVFNIVVLAIYPNWIAPLFNKFTPLGDEHLRTRIETLMRQCGFSASGLFVMDGSRRSAHGNAYFTGFGQSKRVVFFDTLLERLAGEEIEAVLAHELGHFARRHVLKRIALMFASSLLVLAALGAVGNDPALRLALGIPASTAALLLYFSFSVPYLLFPLQPLMSAWSRQHEFEADAYAAQYANPSFLVSALVKLYEDNASTLTPDPWHSAIYDSHPPALVRIGRLDRLIHA